MSSQRGGQPGDPQAPDGEQREQAGDEEDERGGRATCPDHRPGPPSAVPDPGPLAGPPVTGPSGSRWPRRPHGPQLGPHHGRREPTPPRLAGPVGAGPAAAHRRGHHLARLRRAAPDPAALLHPARRRPADAGRRGGGLAGGAARSGEPVFGWLADRAPRAHDDDHRARCSPRCSRCCRCSSWGTAGSSSCAPCRASPRRCTTRPHAPTSWTRTRPSARARRSGCTARRRPAASCSGRRSAALAAAITGQPEVVFWVAGISLLVSAALVAAPGPGARSATGVPRWRQRRRPRERGGTGDGRAWSRPDPPAQRAARRGHLLRRWGSYFAGGSYEVVWSLYMTSLGADLGRDRPHVLLLRPAAAAPVAVHGPLHRPLGRLLGARGRHVRASRVCGFLYPRGPGDLVDGGAGARRGDGVRARVAGGVPARGPRRAGRPHARRRRGCWAARGPSARSSRRSPPGSLAAIDLRLPFWVVGVVGWPRWRSGLAIGRRRLYDAMQPRLPPRRVRVAGRAERAAAGAAGARDRPGRCGWGRPRRSSARPGGARARRVPDLAARLPADSPALLRDRGAADVVVGERVDDGLAARRVARPRADPHPVRAGPPRGLAPVRRRWRAGRPVLVVGHSAGGMSARLLTSPVPFAGRPLGRLVADRRDRDARDAARRGGRCRVAEPGRRRGRGVREPRRPGAVLRAGGPATSPWRRGGSSGGARAPRGERRTWRRLPAA